MISGNRTFFLLYFRALFYVRFVILATDGLWDYLTDEEAVAVVADCVLRNDKV